MNKMITMGIRVSEKQLKKLKQVSNILRIVNLQKIVLIEASKILVKK